MNLKTFFKILVQSFYSPELYLTVISKWQHWGLGFLLRFSILVILIASIILFTLISMVDFNADSVKSILNKIPELKITDGTASFVNPDIKSPVYVQPSKSVLNIIIIDLDTNDPIKYQNDCLISFIADRIVLNLIQSSSIEVSYKDLIANSDTNIVSGTFLLDFLNIQQKKVLGMILFVGIPLGSLIYFGLTIVKSMFFSGIASLFAMIFKVQLSFKQLTRIAIISNVPAVLASSILSVLFFKNVASDIDQILVIAVHLFYFIGAILYYLRKTEHS